MATIPLPPGGLEKAQKALDLGATKEEVEALVGSWVRVIDGVAVDAATAPPPVAGEEVPELVRDVQDAQPAAEAPAPVAPEQPAEVLPEQAEPVLEAPVEEAPTAVQEAPSVADFGDPAVDDYWKSLQGDYSARPFGRKEERPGAVIQLGAAITALSPTKALYDELKSPIFAPDPAFNFMDHFEEIKQTIHPDYWEAMATSRSRAELDHKLQKVSDERFAMETIFAGNKVVGGMAVVGAIIGDPTNLAAGAGELALMTKLGSVSRVRNALTTAATLGASGAATESIVAQARETVTADDVVAGALIGGTLGLGLGAALRPARHTDLMNETKRISSEVREQRSQPVAKDLGDAPGGGYVATADDLPPRRFQRVVESAQEDRAAVAAAIREKTQELRQAARSAATTKASKEGLRTAKKALEKARQEASRIDQLPGRPGRRAAQQRLTAAERVVDDILQAQQASRTARAASQELAAFQRMTRDQKVASIFGDEGAPTITRARFEETAESKLAREQARATREAAEQAEEAPVGGGSVGAARAETEETPVDLTLQQRDIIDQAEEWVAANEAGLMERLSTKTGATINRMAKAGVSMDSTFFLTAKSAVAKHFGATVLENGAGLGGREKTAAILRDMYFQNILHPVMLQYRTSYNSWAHQQGISRFNLKKYYGEGKTRFDRLLREELEQRRLARSDDAITDDTAIRQAADAWQKGMDEALKVMKETGVRGAADIDRVPGYVPLKWRGDILRRMKDSDRDAYRTMLAHNYVRTLGIDLEDANLMANAVFQRAMKKELQLDTNPAALLTGDARAELRSMFEEAGVNPGRLEKLLERIDNRTADRGKFKSLRGRNEVDLAQVVNGKSLMDLVANDMDVLVSRYSAEAAGRSALARKGIRSDADWDTVKRTLVQDMVAKDSKVSAAEITTRADAVYSQLLGRPVGEGVNRNMRRLMELATLSMLGQVGFAQLAELGAVTGQLGMRTMIEEIPSMGRFLRSARRGDADPDLIDDIEGLLGGIGNEHMLFRPEVRLEDAAGDDQTWLQVIDKGLAAGQDMLGYASGMNHIKRLEQRLAVKVLSSKVANLAMGRSAGRLTPERLADIGWDEAQLERIKRMISQHAEFSGGRVTRTGDNVRVEGTPRLERLNMEQWDPATVEDFAVGLNRFTHQIVQRPLAGETAHWMHSTLGAMFTQFRHFPIVAMEKQLARNTIHSDMTTFLTVTYGLAWSGMAYIAKQVANAPGQEEGWLEDRLTADKIGKGAVQYSGMAAMIPDGVSVLAYAGIVPAEWAFNPGRTGGHRQSSLSLQTIPALGAAEDLFNAATTPTRMLWDDYEFGKKDVSAIQGATVLGNTLPANIIFGLMKQAAE